MSYTVNTPLGKFEYKDDTHEYFLDGVKLDHNTGILESAGITDFSRCPPETLKLAQDRGKAVHKAIEYLESGILDWGRLHPLIAEFMKGYTKFKAVSHFKPVIVERPMFSKIMGYGTTPDAIGTIFTEQRWAIVEFKTGQGAVEAGKIQTAGHLLVLPEMRWDLPAELPENPDRYVVELREDDYKVHGPFLPTEIHTAIFKAAIWIHRYKTQMKNGGTK